MLGRITDVFSLLSICIAPFGSMNANHSARSVLVGLSLISLCLTAKVCGVFSNKLTCSCGGLIRAMEKTDLSCSGGFSDLPGHN